MQKSLAALSGLSLSVTARRKLREEVVHKTSDLWDRSVKSQAR